jgi:hypothetical protein
MASFFLLMSDARFRSASLRGLRDGWTLRKRARSTLDLITLNRAPCKRCTGAHGKHGKRLGTALRFPLTGRIIETTESEGGGW